MPFTPENKNTGDLVTADNWNDVLAAIVDLFGKLDRNKGHKHTGSAEDGPKLSTNSIANHAITGAKIKNRTITASKLAAGVLGPEIGVAITAGLSNGQFIPVPSGFTRKECLFYAAIKYISVDTTTNSKANLYNTSVNNEGKVTAAPSDRIALMGMAIGKKGGW